MIKNPLTTTILNGASTVAVVTARKNVTDAVNGI